MSKQINGSRHRSAEIDGNPSATGIYGTESINFFNHVPPQSKVIFTLRDGSSAFTGTVTLQFKGVGDPGWSDHASYSSAGDREVIDVGGDMWWRAVVKTDSDYTSGVARFGFNW